LTHTHQMDPKKELSRRKAQWENFRDVTKQLAGLKWRLNVLNGVTAHTAGSSNNHHHHPISRAFILRKLKYALQKKYRNWFPLPSPDMCTVLLLFDIDEEPFFQINAEPEDLPEGWPTGLDLCSAEGIEVELYSLAIYKKLTHTHHFTGINHQMDPKKELSRRKAQWENFRDVTKQLAGLKWRLNVLNGVTADTAGSSNNHHPRKKSREYILEKLKYALHTQYEDWFPLPSPDMCTVLLLFDINEEPFFQINAKPKEDLPEGWPTGLDLCNAESIEVELYSLAIYKKVLEAFREEQEGPDGMVVEEPPRTSGMVSSSSGSNGGGKLT
ncbi:hypothetical protein TYRP_005502, partial [Tyrophagus putrescentiae]